MKQNRTCSVAANGGRTSAFRQGGVARRLKVLRAGSVFSAFPGFQNHTDPLIRSARRVFACEKKEFRGPSGEANAFQTQLGRM